MNTTPLPSGHPVLLVWIRQGQGKRFWVPEPNLSAFPHTLLAQDNTLKFYPSSKARPSPLCPLRQLLPQSRAPGVALFSRYHVPLTAARAPCLCFLWQSVDIWEAEAIPGSISGAVQALGQGQVLIFPHFSLSAGPTRRSLQLAQIQSSGEAPRIVYLSPIRYRRSRGYMER